MKAVAAFLLVLCGLAITHAWNCGEAPNLYRAQQIEAGQGKVIARDRNGYAYFLIGSAWYRMSGYRFYHISVGPAGLWGAGVNRRTYKYVAGNFVQSSGQTMYQLDAGGSDQLVGVTTGLIAFCVRGVTALTHRGGGSLSWTSLRYRFRHISCSPLRGCWAVDTSYYVWHTQTMTSSCRTARWVRIPGQNSRNRMRMVDVGTDGTVIGLSIRGQVYQRTGFSSSRRCGTGWANIPMCMRISSLSYDLRHLWVVTNSGIIVKCTR